MPGSTILEISQPEQEWMLAELRRARHGYLLAFHVLLLCTAGRTPTEIATCLFCSRSSVYRIVQAYQAHLLDELFAPTPARVSWLSPSLRRSLVALLKKVPSAYGWCRTRWSCATLAAQRKIRRGIEVSASTLRRWLHREGWVWKRAQLFAFGVAMFMIGQHLYVVFTEMLMLRFENVDLIRDRVGVSKVGKEKARISAEAS